MFLLNEVLQNKKLQLFLKGPHFKKHEKHDFINTVFHDKLSLITKNMLHIIIDTKRTFYLNEILREYIFLVNLASGFQKGNIYTAVALEEEEKKKLTSAFEKYTGKKLKIKFFIEPWLIGGMIFKSGGFLLDQSVRGNLKRLKYTFGMLEDADVKL